LRIPITSELSECASFIGQSIGIADYIKRVPFNLRKYRLYLPEDLQRKHNVTVRTLWSRHDGKPKEELFDLVLEVAAYSREMLIKARDKKYNLPP
jgi:NADH dehydrogenase [ubiquinone] 1 alpha subcomplex assembly factor 6